VTAPTWRVHFIHVSRSEDGKNRSITTVEIKMMTMLVKLLSTKMVANKWRGARTESGCSSKSKTLWALTDCSWSRAFSRSCKSAGDKLKNATSDPDMNALKRRSTAMAPMGTKSCKVQEVAKRKCERRTLNGEVSIHRRLKRANPMHRLLACSVN
jgi:hypothetical protein